MASGHLATTSGGVSPLQDVGADTTVTADLTTRTTAQTPQAGLQAGLVADTIALPAGPAAHMTVTECVRSS